MRVFTVLIEIIKNFRLIKRMMADGNVSFWKKALIVVGIVYLILPFEIVPDILLPFGLMDDIILWLLIMYILKDTMRKYRDEDSRGERVKYKRGNIIEGVSYEVKSEDEVHEDGEGEESEERNSGNS